LTAASVPQLLRGVFRVEQRIGAGGMGVVYRAVDLNLHRDVAIKALLRLAPDQAARLRREARAMAAVTHPNLAVIHSVETWKTLPLLVQEYVAGGTLATRLQSAPLTIAETFRIGITLADLLDYLHGTGVIHCDIKPSNIGFTQHGMIKLLDFGLARILRDRGAPGTESTTTNQRRGSARPVWEGSSVAGFGTPAYMSPEAARGDEPTPLIDLWSLSVVLYLGLTGRHPFPGADVLSVQQRIVAGPADDVRMHRADAPDGLSEFFLAAFDRDPARRALNAAAFAAQIRRLQQAYC
jgi:serine/threonine-protein kinase